MYMNTFYCLVRILTMLFDKMLTSLTRMTGLTRMLTRLDAVSFHGTNSPLLVAGFHGFLYPPSSHATSTVSSAIFSTLPIQGASLGHSVNKATRWPTSSEVCRSQSPFSGFSCGYTTSDPPHHTYTLRTSDIMSFLVLLHRTQYIVQKFLNGGQLPTNQLHDIS